jgi:hypothetical protein
VLNIVKRGFALFSRVVHYTAMGQTWILVKAQSQTVDPKQPIVLVDLRPDLERQRRKGVRITVPANSLVDSSGTPASGPLTAYLATLNIRAGEAPGDWGARDAGGKEVNLTSYGAAFVEFLDAAGTKFNLAPGASATVEMQAPLPSAAPPTATMWSYDESDGYWKASGRASLAPAIGTFLGKVNHLSVINTDLSKTDASCLKVLLYPPIPTGVKLRVTDPTGGSVFSQSFDFVLTAAINAIYRLPANTNVALSLFDATNTAFSGLLLEEVPGTPLPSNVVNSGPAIPPGHTLWPPEPYDDCKLVVLRLDVPATPSVFLTLKGEGDAAKAAGYYAAVDPNSLRTTLGDWWNTNGFNMGPDGVPTNAVRTSYLNNNDLGSGRDMYFLQRTDGTVAAYVTNYGQFDQNVGNADLAASRNTPGATVCMEYSPVEGQGTTRIVKFFVFAGGGGGAGAARQSSADLDGFGQKFVPNLCLNCHGGSYEPVNPAVPTFAEINAQASFRELDLETYKYPGARDLPDQGEKDRFKQQNLVVKGLNAGDAITRQSIKDLITNWYASGTADQDNTWTPPGWTGSPQSNLYHDVVKRSCRTCHVAFVSSDVASGLNWTRYDQLKGRHSFLKSFVLCEAREMPHAVITYRNFWLSGSPHRPGKLRDFVDGANWTQFGDCK